MSDSYYHAEMNCSGLIAPIGDCPLWGIVAAEGFIQVAFGSGEGGLVVSSYEEAQSTIDHIQKYGAPTICDQKLSGAQAAELVAVLVTLLKSL